MSKSTTSHLHETFLYISWQFLYDYDVKMTHFAFYEERNQALAKFYFSFYNNLDMVPWNSTLRRFAYFWQSKWVEIIATKTEKTLIHILSDVVVAVALLHLKVHNKKRPKPQNNFDKFSRRTPPRLTDTIVCNAWGVGKILGSLSNNDGDGYKNVT